MNHWLRNTDEKKVYKTKREKKHPQTIREKVKEVGGHDKMRQKDRQDMNETERHDMHETGRQDLNKTWRQDMN